MSQQFNMNPSINLSYVDDTGYQGRANQYQDAFFHDWSFPSARISINSVPSPTATVRSAPAPITVNRMSLEQSSKNVQYYNIDPNLHNARFLAPPGGQSAPLSQDHVEPIADPIIRFHQGDDPWNPMKYTNSGSGRDAFNQPHRSFRQYRQGPASDLGSNARVSDSGYHTQPPQSIGHIDQELPPELLLQTKTMNVQSTPSDSHEMQRNPSDQRSISQYSNRSGRPRQSISCPEPNCNVTSNCNSEHKKHMLKHIKSFVCTEEGCKRGGKGFSTVNDLDRHKKSVHGIGLAKSKSYRCAADGCQNKLKVWPRLDNFKQHVDRMHKGEDLIHLIKRSEFVLQDPQTAMQSEPAIDPSHLVSGMDTQTAMTTMDSNDGTLSMSMQHCVYPPFVSISGQSRSGALQLSPSAQLSNVSFSQPSVPNFESTTQESSSSQSFTGLDVDAVNCPSVHQRSQRVSSVGKVVKPTQVRSSRLAKSSVLQVGLSSAPQTKSEQQRQRLDLDELNKLPKAKLQELLRQLFESQQQAGDSETGNVRDQVRQRPKPPRSPERSSTQGSTSSAQQCPYQNCSFSGRNCDLNKHMKRHTKPYGCTYPKCYQKFGAKSDWKRHENSQHFQQETFRCDLPHPMEICGQHFYVPAKFRNHLELEHKVVSERVQEIIDRCKIGKNCQGQYWCGFCCAIVPLKTTRNSAWDERFDHIATHFEKDIPKKNIDDWICVEENKTKKKLQEEMLLAKEWSSVDVEELDDNAALERPPPMTAQIPEQKECNKRSQPADFEQSDLPSKKTRTVLWYCCACHDGPFTTLQVTCLCTHAVCSSCDGVYADDNEV